MITLTIKRLRFQGLPLLAPITADLFIRPYYGTSFTLIEAGVPIDSNGNILASPLPSVSIDPTQSYVIRAVNDSCGAIYDQDLFIHPYCPPGYSLSMDDSFCFLIEETLATPPSNPQITVAKTFNQYGVYGTLIYDPGYGVNGTGTFTQIPYTNAFWVNGPGYPNTTSSTTDAPLNRAGLWAAITMDNQTIGFSECITIGADGVFYVGVGVDDYATIKVDGTIVVQMDVLAMNAFIQTHGYPSAVATPFRFWHIYPVNLTAGSHVLEIIGTNLVTVAAMGAEIYNATKAQIIAATSYVDFGPQLIFSTKDFIGSPVQSGSSGIGYSCPAGFSLKYCESPIVCVRTLTTPILY